MTFSVECPRAFLGVSNSSHRTVTLMRAQNVMFLHLLFEVAEVAL